MRIPLSKLKAIILYFCQNTDPKFLGKVKLMKLFYFSDFGHVKRYGSPITFDNYVKFQKGPVPSAIIGLVGEAGDDIDSSDLADIIDIVRPEGTIMQQIVCRRTLTEDELKMFTPSELKILKSVCERFGDKNTEYIVDASHKEAPWRESRMYEDIPYNMATLDSDCEVNAEEIELALV